MFKRYHLLYYHRTFSDRIFIYFFDSTCRHYDLRSNSGCFTKQQNNFVVYVRNKICAKDVRSSQALLATVKFLCKFSRLWFCGEYTKFTQRHCLSHSLTHSLTRSRLSFVCFVYIYMCLYMRAHKHFANGIYILHTAFAMRMRGRRRQRQKQKKNNNPVFATTAKQ